MATMQYCAFENPATDMRICLDKVKELTDLEGLEEHERHAFHSLMRLCKQFLEAGEPLLDGCAQEAVYWVDIPTKECVSDPDGPFVNVGEFSNYHDAVTFAQSHFGADAEGKICLITGGGHPSDTKSKRPGPKEYRVTWQIDIDAISPHDAAAQALAIMRDPFSSAVCFTIDETATRESKKITVQCNIDLEEAEETE